MDTCLPSGSIHEWYSGVGVRYSCRGLVREWTIDGTVEDVGVGLSSPAVYLTVAEYFREDLQQDVLLFIDNIFRFGTSPGHISGEVQSTCPSVASVPAFIRETTENVSANLGYILGVWEQWRNNSDALVPSVNWVVPAPAVCTWAR